MNDEPGPRRASTSPDDCRALDQVLAAARERFESRIRAGGMPRIEDLASGFPREHRLAVLSELVALEVALRRARDEFPAIAEYQERFPELRGEMERILGSKDADSSDDTAFHQPSGNPSVSPAEADAFLQRMVHHGLIDAGDEATLRDSLLTEGKGTDPSRGLVDALIARRRLTPYQAAALVDSRLGPVRLDRYLILERIGAGGMGVVYKARHRALDRIVALKTMPHDEVDTPEKSRRFLREAKAVARLEHSNIVRAFDAGSDRDVHFLVMEYVDGETLSQLVARRGPLAPGEAARALAQVARGLAHAHERGIIHRDIKPQNLILGHDGVVKILDMGLARMRAEHVSDATTESPLTLGEGLMGTVSYMAPEQARDPRSVDHRADLYALGCTLHFLLTGRAPYAGGVAESLLAHRDAPIPSLRATLPEVSPALESIFRSLLAKRPEDRPATALEVATSLDRCAATPSSTRSSESSIPSRPRRSGRSAATLGVLAASVALGLAALSVRHSWTARPTGSEPPSPRVDATSSPGETPREIAASPPVSPGRVDIETPLPGLIPNPARLPGLGRWQVETREPRGPAFLEVSPSPDGTRLAIADGTGTIRVVKSDSFALLSMLLGHTDGVLSVAWSPDGKRLASAGRDGTARVWWAGDGRPVAMVRTNTRAVTSLSWSPDGARFAGSCADRTTRIWDAACKPVAVVASQQSNLNCLAWTPDGKSLATGSIDGITRLWNAADGSPGLVMHAGSVAVRSLAWAPQAEQGILAIGLADGSVRLQGPDGALLSTAQFGPGLLLRLSWSPDGRRLAAGGANGVTRLWDIDERGQVKAMSDLAGQAAEVFSVAWLADGHLLTASTWDRAIRFWSANGTLERSYRAPFSGPLSLAWSPDGKTLATGSETGLVRFWGNDGSAGAVVNVGPAPVNQVEWSPSGDRVATITDWTGRWINLVDTAHPKGDRLTWTGKETSRSCLAWSPDGSRVAVGHHDGSIQLWDALDGTEGRLLEGHARQVTDVSWSPDSSRLVSASADGTARIWTVGDGSPGPVLPGHQGTVWSAVWSPKDDWIATTGDDGTIRVWSVNGKPLDRAPASDGLAFRGMTASPDGARLALLPNVEGWQFLNDISIRSSNGSDLGSLQGHDAPPKWVSFSPDGRQIATAGPDQTVRIWDASTFQPIWVALSLPEARAALFSPKGERLGGDASKPRGDLVYLIEQASGAMEIVAPAEFDRRARASGTDPH